MKRKPQRKGFTIIEVSLVLAVTGLLLVGIMAGVTGSVARQRYNDSVQSVVDHLRSVYNDVNNPQGPSDSGGTSNRAIYGKVVYLGLNSSNISEATPIYSSIITGFASAELARSTTGDTLLLKDIDLQELYSSRASYVPPWSTRIENTDGNAFTGILIITHTPNGGAIHTYYIDAAQSGNNITVGGRSFSPNNDGSANLKRIIEDGNVTKDNTTSVDLCINSPDINSAGGARRNIRIAADGRNASAVQLINVDSEDNKCK